MTKPFQVAVVLALLLIALAAFRFSENGRYQYTNEIILDTRSGEGWNLSGDTHFNPRAGIIAAHQVHVEDSRPLEACMDGKTSSWLLHPIAMHTCTSYLAALAQIEAKFPHWTDENARGYLRCMPESLRVWTSEAPARYTCEVEQEHSYWRQTHPQVAEQPENKEAVERCIARNAVAINGSSQQFHLAYDECMNEGYNLFDFQPEGAQGKFRAEDIDTTPH
jgi:hypothetical protein